MTRKLRYRDNQAENDIDYHIEVKHPDKRGGTGHDIKRAGFKELGRAKEKHACKYIYHYRNRHVYNIIEADRGEYLMLFGDDGADRDREIRLKQPLRTRTR